MKSEVSTNHLDKEIRAFIKEVQPVRVSKQPRHRARRQSRATQLTYSDFFKNRIQISRSIQNGLPYQMFIPIQAQSPFTEKDWAGFLDMSTKSLQRYKESAKRFKPIHSEKIIELAEVTHLGLEVFGQMEKFKLWLQTPSYALGSYKPIELLKDSYGKELVIGELTRINHGIFS